MSDPTNGIPPVPTPSVPAGWYDDGSGRQRYWDGSAWTDHYLDAQSPTPVGAGEATGATAAYTDPAAPKTSRKGLWITIAVVGGLLLLLILGAIAAAVIGVVSRVADEVSDAVTPGITVPTEQPIDEEPAEEPAEEAPAGEPAVFGESWEYTDGLAITISEPKPFEPSDTAFASEAAAYVVFEVTITNGTAADYEPLVITSVQSGDAEAEEVFDSENGLEGAPSTTLLPGREVTFQIGYGVADAADLVMEVTPGFQYENAIFVSSR
jgi:hypothetical protein